MRELTDVERLQRLMEALGDEARKPGRVYFTGGATALLFGWRRATVDVDLSFEGDAEMLLRGGVLMHWLLRKRVSRATRTGCRDLLMRLQLILAASALVMQLCLLPASAGDNVWTTNGPPALPRTVKSLTIDPSNPSKLYAGTTLGEIFSTTDAAESWQLVTDGLPFVDDMFETDFAVRVAVNPQSSDTLYAATVLGVYKSADGGSEWEPASDGLPPEGAVHQIVVDPFASTTLYAAVVPGGVFKSVDAADTWVPTANGLEGENGAVGLTIDQTSNETLYAATIRPLRRDYFKTTNGGQSWARLDLPEGNARYFANLVISPANSSVLYAGLFPGVYRSGSAGASWDLAASFTTPGRIAADPGSPEIFYVGQVSGVVRVLLLDSGLRGVALVNGLPTGPMIYDLAVDPTVPTRVYAAGREGVYRIDQTPEVCGNFAVENDEECDLGDRNGVEGGCCTDSCAVDRNVCAPCQICSPVFGCGGQVCTPTSGPSPTPTPLPCAGDCNLDGRVTVDELVTLVNIALGVRPIGDCLPGDLDDDNQATVDEIVATVQSVLNGCPV